MKIETLREIVDLSETLNFTRSAANCFITQPALSRHIASAEEELGITIFNREKHGVTLTTSGKAVVEEARHVIAAYDTLLDRTTMFKEGYDGVLRVGYLVAASRPFLSQTASNFEKNYPNVSVQYSPLTPKGIRDGLEEGSIDLGFTADTFIELEDPLKSTAIYKDLYCIAVGRTSDLFERNSIELEDLAGREISFPDKDFAPVEGKMYRKVFNAIPYVESKREHRDLQDASLVLADGAVAAPMLGHARFFGDRSFKLIPFGHNPFPPAHIIAVWNEERKSPYTDEFVGYAKSVPLLLSPPPAEEVAIS